MNTETKQGKTKCQQHRIKGFESYAFANGWVEVCRGCGLTESRHETLQETDARKAGA